MFCAPIVFKNLLKTGFSIRNILLQFVSGVYFFLVIGYFLFEKEAVNGLLKVIGIQIILLYKE